MIKANQLLKESLDGLAGALGDLGADYASDLKPIREALAKNNERGTDTDDWFIRNLKDLAEAVITVRKAHQSEPLLGKLPIPPYDLWLPFKAKDSTDSDRVDFEEAKAILKNHKIVRSHFAAGASPAEEAPKSSKNENV